VAQAAGVGRRRPNAHLLLSDDLWSLESAQEQNMALVVSFESHDPAVWDGSANRSDGWRGGELSRRPGAPPRPPKDRHGASTVPPRPPGWHSGEDRATNSRRRSFDVQSVARPKGGETAHPGREHAHGVTGEFARDRLGTYSCGICGRRRLTGAGWALASNAVPDRPTGLAPSPCAYRGRCAREDGSQA
jgi:hypothetical protein